MRLGQTSIVAFVSKFFASAIGFAATLYFARVLGAEILGIYAVVVAVVMWLELGGSAGISSALTKRLSEGRSEAQFFTAAALLMGAFILIVTFVVILAGRYVDAYIREFGETTGYSVVPFIVALSVLALSFSLARAVLQGQHKVHVAALLSAGRTCARSIIQIALVLLGFGLLGMVTGFAIGTALMAVLGVVYASVSVHRPKRQHFRSLIDYAKFSWLGRIEQRAFNDVDVLVLAAFVPAGLVGVYSVSWSIATLFMLFGRAVESALFPEISRVSAQNDPEATRGLIEDALGFGGLICIPGLFGGFVMGERILQIYGPEFVQGQVVLWLLILAILLYSYQLQLLNTLNAIDRPDITFRINLFFIVLNIGLNVVLVWKYGWVGAAVATVSASGIGLVVTILAVQRLVGFTYPVQQIASQFFAAGFMAIAVWGVERWIETSWFPQHNVAIVLILVSLGSGVYFSTLFAISRRFRRTVIVNLPLEYVR